MSATLTRQELKAAHCWEAEDRVPRRPAISAGTGASLDRRGGRLRVVFPTAIEPVDASGTPYHVYHGMADSRTGVGLLRRTGPQS